MIFYLLEFFFPSTFRQMESKGFIQDWSFKKCELLEKKVKWWWSWRETHRNVIRGLSLTLFPPGQWFVIGNWLEITCPWREAWNRCQLCPVAACPHSVTFILELLTCWETLGSHLTDSAWGKSAIILLWVTGKLLFGFIFPEGANYTNSNSTTAQNTQVYESSVSLSCCLYGSVLQQQPHQRDSWN